MTVEFRPLKPGHLGTIQAQPEQQLEQVAMLTPAYERMLLEGPAMGAWVGPRIVAAAGLLVIVPRRVLYAWCLLSRQAGRYMLPITRKCRDVMDAEYVERVEMWINVDTPRGERWALAMGFVRETVAPLRKRGTGGEDQHIYARVK